MEVLYSIFVIYVLPFGIASFILFYVMKAAVSSVLDDRDVKRKKDAQNEKDKENIDELIILRDMELLTDAELEEVIDLYKAGRAKEQNYEQYNRFLNILDELKESEYLTSEQYIDKCSQLKNQFNIE